MSREELVQNAVLFLQDPKVRDSSLTSRITFLEGKGLTENEIQEALRRSGGGNSNGPFESSRPSWERQQSSSVSRAHEVYAQSPPVVPGRDWRDVFIMAVISGGVVYGLTALARKYLVPHLKPPTTSSFQQTSTSLEEQYDKAQSLLDELKTSTKTLQDSLESDREKINSVVEEVEGAVRSVKDNEERWRDEMREVRSEVESVRDLVPKMIEKHSATQSQSLKDLQTELRSLKALLQARTQPPPPSSETGGSLSGSASSPSLSHDGSNGVSATTAAANALLTPKNGSRGIPAWQKAKQEPVSAPPSESVDKGKGKAVEAEVEGDSSA